MARRPATPLDTLPHILNDVIVTTGKAFKAARRDGKGSSAEASASLETRIPAAVEKFNSVLDDLECDILRAKAVLLRDLNQLRAKHNPPPAEQKPVAPPAPMVIDLESPELSTKEPPAGPPGPSSTGPQVNKPVAPFPNMGFESTSPEIAPAPSPKTAPKPKETKNLNNPAAPAAAAAAAAATRPTSAPPKKDVKVPAPQVARPSSVATAPQTPQNPAAQTRAPSSVPAQNRPAAATAAANNPAGPAAAVPSAPPPAGNGSLFTDMTFSLAPPPGDAQGPKQAAQAPRMPSQPQAQPPAAAADAPTSVGAAVQLPGATATSTEQTTGGAPAGGAASTDLGVRTEQPGGEDTSMADADAKIDGLFDLGPTDMEDINHDYDFGNGDNSNFNDMYFATGDSGGGAEDLDDAFFNLNG
ncbi:f16c55b7-ca3c-498a-8825-e57ca3d98944 [Thermothielavioides terrestris]|uniref:Uncharacterized protein n=2 Tax=Thermothielavioides terrestris TaxID=2587410 RepID=G2R9V1_THETT|nr:uncharacterized protein THITE_2091079 [Thermothielavioides terrestris NRRL 8126]AEO69592.1 hypothetical protein THITE_2091079 [Thermothielavioides terrestris NRRL 8126]SPQ26111.1 f16c55b7-ca3c-498a-8825-e57ca3d98944 [Thermothielavioides terrestris]